MRIRWRGLELPHRIIPDEETLSDTYGKFTIEPFERGFGTTVGNSLRRILLSSLHGAPITGVKIKGAEHEFSSLEGVMEDVTLSTNISREGKIEFLKSLDLLCVPAMYGEAFGLYLVEALAAGTPVCQPDVASFPELIEETGGGVLYSHNKANSLSDTLSLKKSNSLPRSPPRSNNIPIEQ